MADEGFLTSGVIHSHLSSDPHPKVYNVTVYAGWFVRPLSDKLKSGCQVVPVVISAQPQGVTGASSPVFFAASQVSLFFLVVASTIATLVGLLTLLFFLIRWLNRPLPARSIQACPRCGDPSVKVGYRRIERDGFLEASVHCTNCGQHSAFETEEI